MTVTRWPFAPLAEVCAALLGPIDQPDPRRNAEGATVRRCAAACGVNTRTWERWAATGWLSDRQADRAAIALGYTPSLIWPDWYAAAPELIA